MNDIQRNVTAVVCLFLVALGVLVLVGIQVSSDWDTFVPDLIIGVIGASAISGTVAWSQHRSEVRRSSEAGIAAAYSDVLESLTQMKATDLQTGDPGPQLGRISLRLGLLYELVDDDALARWFEAERQLALFRAGQSMRLLNETISETSTVDEIVEAYGPILKWVAEFTNNLRFWRRGKVDQAQMRRQADNITALLRSEGAWRETTMPWRSDSPETPG